MEKEVERIRTGFCYEDLPLGRRFRTRRRTITESDLGQFTNLSWLTEELFTTAARRPDELLQGRVVPGAMVYAFAEGLVLPTFEGTGLAFLETQLDARHPTVVGDTLHVHCEVVERRPTSTPGRGLVRTMNLVMTDSGTVVLSYNPLRIVRTRVSTPSIDTGDE